MVQNVFQTDVAFLLKYWDNILSSERCTQQFLIQLHLFNFSVNISLLTHAMPTICLHASQCVSKCKHCVRLHIFHVQTRNKSGRPETIPAYPVAYCPYLSMFRLQLKVSTTWNFVYLIDKISRNVKSSDHPVKRGKQSRYRPGEALRFPGSYLSQISLKRHRMVVGCQPKAPTAFTPQEIFLVLISVRGWVDPEAIVRSEGFYVNEKSTINSWDRTSDFPICSTAP